MKNNLIMLTMTMLLGLTVALEASAAPASNCDTLKLAICAADNYLDAVGVQFPSLGNLVSTSLLDPTQFGMLNGLLVDGSDGVVNGVPGPLAPYSSVQSLISNIAACRLVPYLIAQINDSVPGSCP